MVEVRTADASVAVMRSGKETELKVNRFTKWTQQQLTQLADALKTNSALTSLNLQCAVAYRLWTDFRVRREQHRCRRYQGAGGRAQDQLDADDVGPEGCVCLSFVD